MVDRHILNHVKCVVLVCGSCGVTHAIPSVKYDACVEEGGFWHCPNGHSRGYREGRREREAVVRERDRLKQRTAQLEDEVAAAMRETEKVRAKLRRQAKRISVGVCPCCNRTFAKLAMHMKSKHPDYNVVPLKASS